MKLAELVHHYRAHAAREYVKHGRSTSTASAIRAATEYLLEVPPPPESGPGSNLPLLGGDDASGGIGDLPAEELNRQHLRAYLDHLQTKVNCHGKPWTLAHVNKCRQMVIGMYAWAEGEDLLDREVTHELKRCRPSKPGKGKARRSERVPAAPAEVVFDLVAAIRGECRRMPRRTAYQRDQHRRRLLVAVALELMWETGMRAIELVIMRRCDVVEDAPGSPGSGGWQYLPPEWKTEHEGEERRVVGLTARAKALIDEAVWANSTDAGQARLSFAVDFDPAARLFPWSASHPYHARTAMYRAIARALTRAGLPPLTPLQLRHAFATRSVRVDPEGTRVQMGHRRITTTQRYVNDDGEARRQLIVRLGRSGTDGPPPRTPDPLAPTGTGAGDGRPPLRLVGFG